MARRFGPGCARCRERWRARSGPGTRPRARQRRARPGCGFTLTARDCLAMLTHTISQNLAGRINRVGDSNRRRRVSDFSAETRRKLPMANDTKDAATGDRIDSDVVSMAKRIAEL